MAEIETIDIHTDKQMRMKSGLAFKKTFKKLASIKQPWECSWQELHNLRSEITSELEEFLSKTEEEKRTLSESENLAWTHGMYLIEKIGEEFQRREKHGTKEPIDYEKMNAEFHRSMSTPETREVSRPAAGGAEFRSLWYPGSRGERLSTDGFENLGQFFAAVASGRDARLKEAAIEYRENFAGVGAWGGFAIPIGYTEMLLDHALMADEIVRPRALNIAMETPEVNVPMFDSYDRSTGIFGVRLKMYGEGSTIDTQTPLLKNQTIRARKGIIDWECSRELVQDSPGFDSRLRTLLPRVVARDLDDIFIFGNGVTEPIGIANCASTLATARNTSNSIVYADIKALWSKLHPACHKNCVWIVNSASIPELLALKDDANRSLWQPGMSASIAEAVPQSLFGRAILFCETSPALGAKGDIILCDLSQYICAFRQEMTIESTNAANWQKDMISFRLSIRFEGRPVFTDAITLENGSQVSWAAVLNA